MADQEAQTRDHIDPGPIPEAGFLGKSIHKCGFIFAIAILLSTAILILEVGLRYIFNAPTTWAHESVIFLTACTFVFGGLYGAARDKHIRVVLIYDSLSPKMRRLVNVINSFICMQATALFSWAAWLVVQRAIWTPAGDFRLETSGSAWNPPTPGLLKVFLLIILIIMTVQFALLTVNYLRNK